MADDTDPTAIDIEFDPFEQRMKGVAVHGNKPFDVPFVSHIYDGVWQGGCRDGLVLPEVIDFVVSLYPWEKYTINHAAERVEIKMYDSVNQTFEQVDDIARLVIEHLKNFEDVLIHCQAGLNRSSLVAARVLMIDGGWSAKDAIAQLRSSRSDAVLCNPAFEEWLLAFDEESAA